VLVDGLLQMRVMGLWRKMDMHSESVHSKELLNLDAEMLIWTCFLKISLL
jgi:hypothetical protein